METSPFVRVITADRGDSGRRLDLVIRRHLTDLPAATRTRVQRWIETGHVTVNDCVVQRTASRAALGDVVRVALPADARRAPMAGEAIDVDVLYEDEHMLAVDKPAGTVVHPTYKNSGATLMNALLWHGRGWPPEQRPSLVGRLDKLTSGVVLVAKGPRMHAALQRALVAADSRKEYLAVVYGRVRPSQGRIELRLSRARENRRRMVADRDTGAPSLTLFEHLAGVPAPGVGLSLVRCRLITGRTHQIRAHLAARGWPIVGDPVYGEPRWTRIIAPQLSAACRAFPRQALHAWRIGFLHPVTRQPVIVEAPIPRDIGGLLTISDLSRYFPRADT